MLEMTVEFVQSVVGELELTRRAQAARIAELEAAAQAPAERTPSEGDVVPPGAEGGDGQHHRAA
jgi:hypothetical protein